MPHGIVYFHFILVTPISVSNPLAPSLADVSLDDLLEEVEDLTSMVLLNTWKQLLGLPSARMKY